METYEITASAEMDVPASVAYGIIADYHDGHPYILPPQFSNLVVEEGGVGAGTKIRFNMHVLGKVYEMRAVVREPEPGRVLVEDYPADGTLTTFTVDPLSDQRSRVSFHTTMKKKPGIGGWAERLFVKRFLRGVYAEELQKLATLAKERMK